MDNQRFCTGCGRAYSMVVWRKESFCGSCGWPLKTSCYQEKPLEIHPYPDDPASRSVHRPAFHSAVEKTGLFARQHPLLFSSGAITLGIGGIMAGPVLATLGSGVMVAGGIFSALGMLTMFSNEGEESAQLMMAGIMIILAGAGISMVGHALVVAGILMIATGTGLAVKTCVETGLRIRIERQLRQKSVEELVALSKHLEN